MTLRYNVSTSSGTFDTLVATTVTGGTAIFMGNQVKKVTSLSALLTVLAETNTITITAKWQVSNDKTTWVDAYTPQNAANVALGTGTAGADTAVTRVLTAPEGVYGWQYARIALVNGVVTGAAVDTYSIGYCFRQLSAAGE